MRAESNIQKHAIRIASGLFILIGCIPLVFANVTHPTAQPHVMKLASLHRWAAQRGILYPAVEILHSREAGYYAVASKHIKAGDVIFEIPLAATLSSESIETLEEGELLSGLNQLDQVAAFIVLQSAKEASDWSPFFNSWPSELHNLFLWDEEQLKFLNDKKAIDMAHAMKREVAQSWNRVESFFEEHPDVFPPLEKSRAIFAGAHAIIQSRAFGNFRLTPVLDLLNHCPYSMMAPTWLPDKGYVLYADKDYSPGEELCLQYGTKDNRVLLEMYGFVLQNNPWNCWYVQQATGDKYGEIRTGVMRMMGLWQADVCVSAKTVAAGMMDPAAHSLGWDFDRNGLHGYDEYLTNYQQSTKANREMVCKSLLALYNEQPRTIQQEQDFLLELEKREINLRADVAAGVQPKQQLTELDRQILACKFRLEGLQTLRGALKTCGRESEAKMDYVDFLGAENLAEFEQGHSFDSGSDDQFDIGRQGEEMEQQSLGSIEQQDNSDAFIVSM